MTQKPAVTLLMNCLKRNLGSVSIDMYKDKIVYPVINVYIEAGFDFSNESYQDVCDEYIANYLNIPTLYPFIRMLWQCLNSLKIKV